MSKLSQVSLKDTEEKNGHSGQEKRQRNKTKRLFKLSQVSFRKDTAEKDGHSEQEKKTKLQNEEIVQVVSGQFSKGYCREGGHTGRGSCRFLPVSLFTHLGCFYTYHQTYDCKSIFKKSSICRP